MIYKLTAILTFPQKYFFTTIPTLVPSFSGDISPDPAQVPGKSYECIPRLLWDDEIRADDWPKRVKDGVGRCGATSFAADSDKAALNRESCAFVSPAAHLVIALNELFITLTAAATGGLQRGYLICRSVRNDRCLIRLGKERCAGCHWS